MTFLKAFAAAVLKIAGLVTGLAPIIQSFVPAGSQGTAATVISDIAQIGQIITEVEVMGQQLAIAGPGKLAAATPLVAQIILQSSIVAGHKIANPDLFTAGCTKIAGGMADVLNSLHEGGVQVTSMTA